jgi:hypothetical protein
MEGDTPGQKDGGGGVAAQRSDTCNRYPTGKSSAPVSCA